MKKIYLLLLGLISAEVQSQDLVHALLTERKNCFDDLAREMKCELGSAILDKHPIIPFLHAELAKVHTPLEGHTESASTASFSHAEDKVVTGSYDKTAKIWDVASGKCLQTLKGHTDRIVSAKFNGAGDKVVTAADDGTLKIWDVQSGCCLETFFTGSADVVKLAHFTESGDQVVTKHSGLTCSAEYYDIKTWSLDGRCVRTETQPISTLLLKGGWGGGRHIDLSGDDSVNIMDTASGKCLLTIVLPPRSEGFRFMGLSCSGSKMYAALRERTVLLCDVKKLLKLKRFLEAEITYKQAFLLHVLYETVLCRALVKKHGVKAFEDVSRAVSQEQVRCDFRVYPHLQEEYDTLPGEIKNVLEPYIYRDSTSGMKKNSDTKER
jgi:hypothetical protein